MGQYQQWLHYQELERHLRTTVEMLETELAQLESQLDTVFLEQLVQQAHPLEANSIISALFAHQVASINGHAPSNDEPVSSPQTSEQPSNPSNETLSPALLHWGGLPDFGPQEMEQPDYRFASVFPFASHPEIELLPEDMFAFMDEHTQTDPQVELPWWLRKITVASSNAESGKPIDQESMRTNRLVQRWVERWGRQISTAFPAEGESEDTPDAL